MKYSFYKLHFFTHFIIDKANLNHLIIYFAFWWPFFKWYLKAFKYRNKLSMTFWMTDMNSCISFYFGLRIPNLIKSYFAILGTFLYLILRLSIFASLSHKEKEKETEMKRFVKWSSILYASFSLKNIPWPRVYKRTFHLNTSFENTMFISNKYL